MAAKKDANESNERLFTFQTGDDKLIVRIPEVMNPQYCMYTWPSWYFQREMIKYICKTIFNIFCVIYKISAGTALPGVVAAFCGANVTLSDTTTQPNSLKICQKSCEVNDLIDVNIIGINWGIINNRTHALTDLDFILGSDCFYDPKDFEDILFTVAHILSRNPNCKFLSTYQVRSSDWTIEDLLTKWKLDYTNISLASFGGDSTNIADSKLPGESIVEMMEIKFKTDS
uniref:Methyltransferase-like protein 23 n=1 Tax=Strigamia maritima TaxID=126957 RepID=T1J6Y2_STRMM